MKEAEQKYERLLAGLKDLGKVAVAYSGGVDSTFLLHSAKKVLGGNAVAYTVKTPYIPDWEVEEAEALCRQEGIRHRILNAEIPKEIMDNPGNRCYLCKRRIFTLLLSEAGKDGIDHLVDGTNADDTGDYRPGMAALAELGVASPLLQHNLTKEDIRTLSRKHGLPTADKPSYACLLTRLPYDREVDATMLDRIEKAELFLFGLGYRAVRVRIHERSARIELEKNRIRQFIEDGLSDRVILYFKSIGFDFVTLDLEGYRTGSFNDALKNK